MRNSDVAYEKIKMMIITAQLKPGQVLVESELMAELNLGRTPIREALNRLDWENFVKIIPRQCIMVNEIPIYEAKYIYQMRFALLGLESELAVKNRTEEDLAKLEETHKLLRTEENLEKRVLLDRQFHRNISAMTRQPFLEKEMGTLQDLSIRLLFLNRDTLSAIDDKAISMHEEIYRCIRDRDSEKLMKAQKEHVQEFMRKFIR